MNNVKEVDWVKATSAYRSLEGSLTPPCAGSMLLVPQKLMEP